MRLLKGSRKGSVWFRGDGKRDTALGVMEKIDGVP